MKGIDSLAVIFAFTVVACMYGMVTTAKAPTNADYETIAKW